MVQLKRRELFNVTTREEFQFLYGPIKAGSSYPTRLNRALFQFLYGPIKAYLPAICGFSNFNFNSYMVQLKRLAVRLAGEAS